jgi:hypothetical protein
MSVSGENSKAVFRAIKEAGVTGGFVTPRLLFCIVFITVLPHAWLSHVSATGAKVI